MVDTLSKLVPKEGVARLIFQGKSDAFQGISLTNIGDYLA